MGHSARHDDRPLWRQQAGCSHLCQHGAIPAQPAVPTSTRSTSCSSATAPATVCTHTSACASSLHAYGAAYLQPCGTTLKYCIQIRRSLPCHAGRMRLSGCVRTWPHVPNAYVAVPSLPPISQISFMRVCAPREQAAQEKKTERTTAGKTVRALAAVRSMCAPLQRCSNCRPGKPTTAVNLLKTSPVISSETTGTPAPLVKPLCSHVGHVRR